MLVSSATTEELNEGVSDIRKEQKGRNEDNQSTQGQQTDMENEGISGYPVTESIIDLEKNREILPCRERAPCNVWNGESEIEKEEETDPHETRSG